MNTILEVNQVYKYFGGVKANENISLNVVQGSIVGLIGPNGSGKTTLFNSIVGTHPIDKGSIKFEGKELSKLPVPIVAKLGLLRTFQQTRIYGKLNCIQNMLISNKPKDDKIFSVFSKIPEELTSKAEKLLEFVGLYQKRKLRAGDLSFGQQKLLELAMALMNEPKMLLLDEPTAGINPTLINGIIDRLIKVNKEFGITLLVIEHNMKVIMNLAQKIFCLAHGELLAEGLPEQIKNERVRVSQSYTGSISSMVEKILESSRYINTKKNIVIEETSGVRKIISPNMNPFRFINRLSEESISTRGQGHPYFLFFENNEGFHFESLGNLYSRPILADYTTSETTGAKHPRDVLDEYSRPISFKMLNTNNMISNIQGGLLASKMTSYNSFEKTYETTEYNYFDDFLKFYCKTLCSKI